MPEFRSKFVNGIQGDVDKSISPQDSYLAAYNLTLSGSEKFLVLENLNGTEDVATILNGFTGKVLGVYSGTYKIGSTEGVKCLTIFTAVSGGNFKIWCYDTDNDALYELFQQSFTAAFEASDPVIDAVSYPENGLDILYFTDNFNEVRKLRCEIPSPYSANFLTSAQLSLTRRATLAKIILDSIASTGGSILCGSYQFCIRFYNEDRKQYTKWSIPSHPVNISRTTSGLGEGGYGMISSKVPRLRFEIPTSETTLYTHYQVAVFENTQNADVLNASLLKLEDLSVSSSSGGYDTVYFNYESNVRVGTVPVEDIVVDHAAIETIKTLQIKNNRLFGGNITYSNLEYDRGAPTVGGSGAVVTTVSSNTTDFQTSVDKGYFRDEVYRFYISYFDEKYNFSRPKVLDLSGVTGNQAASGIDYRFPNRQTQGFAVLDTSNNFQVLNLSLTINNHPSWARGFVILRAKRKKKIKFQTPFIPSALIEGVEVLGTYPNVATEFANGTSRTTKTFDSASPMNPVGTLIPKNFFFPAKRDYVRATADDDTIRQQKGEVYIASPYSDNISNKVYFVLSPNAYGISNYTFTTGDKYQTVDFAFLKQNWASFQTNPFETKVGNYSQTSVHGTFYATGHNDHYYSNSTSRSAPAPTPLITGLGYRTNGTILDYKELDNFGEGTSIGGVPVGQFSNLETTGVFWNTPPSNQRLGVVLLGERKTDSAAFANTPLLTTNASGSVNSGLYEVLPLNQSNTFSGSTGKTITSSTYTNLVDIVNVVNDLGDDRYGDPEDLHEMVYTGSMHVFNDSQLADVIADGDSSVSLTIAGGDCYVGFHQIKITDNHYGLMNVEKSGSGTQLSEIDVLRRWGRVFLNRYEITAGYSTDGDTNVAMPVPYRNCSQVISVVLESEVLGDVLDVRPYSDTISDNSRTVITNTTNEYSLKTPFPYLYNKNYTKESDQKQFIPFDENEEVFDTFKARVVFTDQKVYNTSIEGFDIIRTSSFTDLEETYGGVTKLVLSADKLFAIQEKALAYMPVDASTIETTDATSLSIRSSRTLDIPSYVSRQYGCQHLRGVVITDDSFFFPDGINKAVIKFGEGLEIISESGMVDKINDIFPVTEQNLIAIYDNFRRQYWLYDKENCWIWDDRFKLWVSGYEFDTRLDGGVYTNDDLYLVGTDGDLKVWKMYTGAVNDLMGTSVTPRVQVSLNPEFDTPKTFDNILLYSNNQLATADITTEGDAAQSVTGMSVDVNNREGNYRIATLRDGNSARLRGHRAILTVYWKNNTDKVALSQIVTKYRTSYRPI